MKRWIVLVLLSAAGVVKAQGSDLSTPSAPPDIVPVVFASLAASNVSPQLGEPFTLTLTVRTPPNLPVVEWPSFQELGEPFEILREGPRLLSQRASEYVYTQTADVVLWATGLHMTPELRVIYERGGRRFFTPVQSVSVLVPAQIVNPLEAQPRPSFTVIDLPISSTWLLPLIVIIVLSFWWLLRRRRFTGSSGVDAQAKSRAAQIAIAHMEDLQSSNLNPDEAILVCVEQLRGYLVSALRISAHEMTSSEIINQLQTQHLLPKRLISALNTLLEQADLIKFANLSPQVSAHQFIRTAIRWVKLTDQAISGLYE
jgi:hypothetical protein